MNGLVLLTNKVVVVCRLSYHSIITIYIYTMVHRIISSSNLELEEERDTCNGARSLAALNVAVLGLLLITEVLILVDWGPTVTKQEYGVLIASISVVYVLVFIAWIRLGWTWIFHGRMARSPVFMLLLASIFNVILATTIW